MILHTCTYVDVLDPYYIYISLSCILFIRSLIYATNKTGTMSNISGDSSDLSPPHPGS